jgi:hypothetical protein
MAGGSRRTLRRAIAFAAAGLCAVVLGGCETLNCENLDRAGFWGFVIQAFGCRDADAPDENPDAAFGITPPSPPHVGDRLTFSGYRGLHPVSADAPPKPPLVRWTWDFNGDGAPEAQGFGKVGVNEKHPFSVVSHRFSRERDYDVVLKVTDELGHTSAVRHRIHVHAPHGGPTGPGNRDPVADVTASPNPAAPNEDVTFDASESNDPDGSISGYEWDLDGDGNFERETDAAHPTTTTSYTPGTSSPVHATVRVTDDRGAVDTESVDVYLRESSAPHAVAHAAGGRARKWLLFARLGNLVPRRNRNIVVGRLRARAVPIAPIRAARRRLPRTVRRLLRARWAVRLTRRRGRVLTGMAAARPRGKGRPLACLRLRLRVPRKLRTLPTGSFALRGGTRAYARARIGASFLLASSRGRRTQAGGTLRYSTGRRRAPAKSCRRLARSLGRSAARRRG